MIVVYGQHGVDDAWTLSFDYYYLKDGYEFDRIFGNGHGVVAYFGKTHAFLYGLWSEIFGWNRLTNRVLSTIFVVAGVFLWAIIAWKMTGSKQLATAFIILCLLLDIFINSATKVRPEALTFFLGAIALLSAIYNRWFWAIIASFIALETHPAGALYGLFVAAVWFSQIEWKKAYSYKTYFPFISLAVLLGGCYYWWLHGDNWRSLEIIIDSSSGRIIEDKFYLISHFFHAKFYRYLPLFFIFIAAYCIFYWKYNLNDKLWLFLNAATLFIIIGAFVNQRGNANYALHAYPIFTLVLLWAYTRFKHSYTPLVVLTALFTLPQYAVVAYLNGNFYFPTYIQTIKKHTSTTENMIHLGHSSHWFAFSDNTKNAHSFYAVGNNKAPIDEQQFVWIRDSKWESLNAMPSSKLKILIKKCPMHLLSSFEYSGHNVRFEQYDCRS